MTFRFPSGLCAGLLFWSALWMPARAGQDEYSDDVGSSAPWVFDIAPGVRMADIAFADEKGAHLSLAALRGKVVVLHFWGSWCGPCRKEMPELQRLADRVADRRDVAFILLQVREPFDVAKRWARQRGIRLPLHDSGARGEDDAYFRLADGGRVADRQIARRFPTTYILDKRGAVAFSHVGAVADWPRHEGFLRDLAGRSGR